MVSGLANLLKPWIKRWYKLAKLRRTWFRPVHHYFNSLVLFFSLKNDTSKGPVAQIPLYLTCNCYGGWAILSLPTLSSSFGIEFSSNLIELALGLRVVVRLSYLVNFLNNQASPLTISLFSAMSADNGQLSDDLVGHALGLGVRGAAINQRIAHHHLQPHRLQPCLLTMTSSLMIWLGAL